VPGCITPSVRCIPSRTATAGSRGRWPASTSSGQASFHWSWIVGPFEPQGAERSPRSRAAVGVLRAPGGPQGLAVERGAGDWTWFERFAGSRLQPRTRCPGARPGRMACSEGFRPETFTRHRLSGSGRAEAPRAATKGDRYRESCAWNANAPDCGPLGSTGHPPAARRPVSAFPRVIYDGTSYA
jgi:hypothetical protein